MAEQPKSHTSYSKASPARLLALEVTKQIRERDAYAQALISRYIDASDLTPEDRSFATRLVLGVVSTQGTLDEVIDRVLRSPSDIKLNVRDALRLSTYEIIFLEKSAHAAVDQGVELVRSCAPKAAGLANAVLRKIVNLKPEFPFGNPAQDIKALARLYAFPEWLAQKLIDELGLKAAVEFMRESNEPAPLFVAVNSVTSSDKAFLAILNEVGERWESVTIGDRRIAGCFRLFDSRSLLRPEIKRLFTYGRLIVSDAASQLVAAAVLPERWPASFLEIGAGRATKTILLQNCAHRLYGDQIYQYVTLDNHDFKTKELLNRTKRYAIEVSEALTGNALDLDSVVPRRRFDEVFVDAPCSGLGTLRRHPEIRWRIKPDVFQTFAHVQLGMLLSAASHVEPGGLLAYATCTVAQEENEKVVQAFLKSKEGTDYSLVPIVGKPALVTQLSSGSSDAHFAVRMIRKE